MVYCLFSPESSFLPRQEVNGECGRNHLQRAMTFALLKCHRLLETSKNSNSKPLKNVLYVPDCSRNFVYTLIDLLLIRSLWSRHLLPFFKYGIRGRDAKYLASKSIRSNSVEITVSVVRMMLKRLTSPHVPYSDLQMKLLLTFVWNNPCAYSKKMKKILTNKLCTK